MTTKRHIADGYYIRTACGRYIKADSDARWADMDISDSHRRGVCRRCEAAARKAMAESFGMLDSLADENPDTYRREIEAAKTGALLELYGPEYAV